MLQLALTSDKRKQLMDAYLGLKTWPDAPSALQSLQGVGIRLGFLSNATPTILAAGLKNSRLEGIFEHVLSTYKPDPCAYQVAIDAFGLTREDILFVPYAGWWDAAGAKSFGYTTFWVNRLNLPAEKLGVAPDAAGQSLADLVVFMNALLRLVPWRLTPAADAGLRQTEGTSTGMAIWRSGSWLRAWAKWRCG
jgi:2-haloacid dehalogenase